MLTTTQWRDLEETHAWQEVVATVKERMRMVNQDLLNPDVCNSEEKRVRFQAEYLTCLWFINLPRMDATPETVSEGEEDEGKKDRTMAPDLESFRA